MDFLLVDDSRVMRQLVRRAIRQAGIETGQIVEAENGNDALQRLEAFRPQVVLSDWNMPEMSGIELLQSLRKKGNPVPFGFITSETTSAMRQSAVEAGALFLLSKPFTSNDLLSALGRVGLTNGGGKEIAAEPGLPVSEDPLDVRSLMTLISQLVGQSVTMSPGAKMSPTASPCSSAVWVNAAGTPLYAGFFDLPAAACLGAAIGLRGPPSAEVLMSRSLPTALQPDVREVFNVMSRAFNEAGSKHVVLSGVTFPPDSAAAAALEIEAGCAARKDFLLQIRGYGAGRLALISKARGFVVR